MKVFSFYLFLAIVACQACTNGSGDADKTAFGTGEKAPETSTTAKSGTAEVARKPGASTPAAQPQTLTSGEYASAKEGWLVDLDEAYEISVREGKPILANFTGSDWCGWCKKLDADVFSKPEFKKWSEKNVVLLELDFPRRFRIPEKNQSQNAAMQNALRVTGFPTIWVLNLTKDPATGQYQINGKGKTGYAPSVDQFIATVDGFVKM